MPEDVINKPSHYHKGGMDVMGYMDITFPPAHIKGFCRGNVLKYVVRYQDKNGVEDLKKAKFYLDKLIELEEGK